MAGRPASSASWPKADSAPFHSSRTTGKAASPAAVRRTPRPARSKSLMSKWVSSRRICWLTADEVMFCWRAAAPTEPVRATAKSVSSAGKSAALIIKGSLPFRPERFTGLHDRPQAACAARRSFNGTHAVRQGVGDAHGPDAAVRPDPAPDRPASDPRGDDAAGLPDAAGLEADGADARAHL